MIRFLKFLFLYAVTIAEPSREETHGWSYHIPV